MAAIVEAFAVYGNYLLALLLTLPRIYAFLSASQLLSAGAVPGLPRTAAILSLAIIAVPINLDYAAAFDRSAHALFLFFAKEYIIGFIAGYLVGWMFWVVQATGGLIDSQRGAAIASAIDPLQGEEASSLGNLFSQAFLTYIFTTGAFLLVLGILYKSYVLWPATRAVPIISDVFPTMMLGLLDNAMRLVFVIAAPILAVMFLAEFSLALISRFSPQVQVFVLAMPIKSILAIFVLIFYVPTFMPFSERQFVTFETYIGRLYQILKFGEKIERPGITPPAPSQGGPR
jgi:type III secretion protein T